MIDSDVEKLVAIAKIIGRDGYKIVAEFDRGFKHTGIEKVGKYFEIAEKRIKDAQCSKT